MGLIPAKNNAAEPPDRSGTVSRMPQLPQACCGIAAFQRYRTMLHGRVVNEKQR